MPLARSGQRPGSRCMDPTAGHPTRGIMEPMCAKHSCWETCAALELSVPVPARAHLTSLQSPMRNNAQVSLSSSVFSLEDGANKAKHSDTLLPL